MRKIASASAREITEDQLNDLKYNALGIMTDCRKTMLQRFPFIGSIAMNLDMVPVRDERCSTACTDGAAIYFDISFLATLKPEERIFVMAHEIWHNVLLHSVRLEGRDRELFNIASDLEINQLLVKDGLIDPEGLCFPRDHRHPDGFNVPTGLNAEQYYELLVKQQQFQQQNNSGNGNASDGDSSADSNDGSGNSDGKLSKQFDKHVYKDDDVDAESKKNVADKYGKVGRDPDFRPTPSEGNVEKIREAAVTAAQNIERSRGELPEHLKQIINDLLEPEVNWRDQLVAHVTRVMGEKSNWNHPNRRFAYNGTYLPSHEGEKLRIAVGIDTSGSTNPDLPKFLGELNGIVNSFGNYELHIIQCDTQVQDYKFYDESNPLDLENNEFEMHGGGGTFLTPIFEYIKDNALDIDACCIFTDGECEDFNEDAAPEFPMLWLISKYGTKRHIHFGEVIEFND